MKKLLLFLLLCVSINAQTVYVNSSTGNDASGNGNSGSPYKTFTKGYNMTNSGGTLDLTGTFTWTDAAETGDDGSNGFTISKNITIQGPSGGLAVVQAASSLIQTQRIFYIPTGYTVTIKNLELRNGYASAATLDGGAITCVSNLTILNCYIHDNMARQGCGLELYSNTIIENSTIANNISTAVQSGLSGGGILLGGGNLTLTNSTVCNNSGVQYGGGIYARNTRGTLIITNCTITDNSAANYDGTQLGYGGGIGIEGSDVSIKNTIVANNSEGNVSNNGADIDHYSGTITDNGYNIIEVENSGSIPGTGDITGNQSNLFGSGVSNTPALADNGTLNGTPTIALGSGSVAFNAGNSSANGSVSVPTTDQRGASRSGGTDIGAYEYDGVLPVELTSFTASSADKKVTLKWQTATEINNYGFEVERTSVQNINREKIGFVQGHGNSNSLKSYYFKDKPTSGNEFKYRLKQIDTDGKFEYSPEVEVNLNVHIDFSVKQNFPNPFNPSTQIEFSIPSDNNVEIKVFNILGMEVATLLNEHRQAGKYSIEFNASNLASGIYFYKIVSGKYSEIKKMILLR